MKKKIIDWWYKMGDEKIMSNGEFLMICLFPFIILLFMYTLYLLLEYGYPFFNLLVTLLVSLVFIHNELKK